MFFCATSVVQIKFANNDFIWSVTYSSYCIVLIRNIEGKNKLIKYTFEFDIKGKMVKNAPVNHVKESNITS